MVCLGHQNVLSAIFGIGLEFMLQFVILHYKENDRS
jgi:hypothetical protein